MDFKSYCSVLLLLALGAMSYAEDCVSKGTCPDATKVSTNATTNMPSPNTTVTTPKAKSSITVPHFKTTVPTSPPTPREGCVTKDVCLQETQSPCSCQTSNGMIDLSKVGYVSTSDDLPVHFASFYYSPCHKFTMEDCKDVLMCEKLAWPGGHHTVGVPSTTKFAKCGKDIFLMYSYGRKSAEVKLVCDQTVNNATFKMTSEKPIFEQDYRFDLRTKFACPDAIVTTTATTVSSTVTATTPPSNTTVTVPHSNTTVTVPHSNTTVTVPHSKTTVTTAPTATTPGNSAAYASVFPGAILASATVIISFML